jgi:peptidoglycan/LPS O-acetylase OafA/YrhL
LSLPFAVSRRDNKQAPSLSQYFARRLTRIEPPYIIAMLIYFVSILAIGKVSFQELLPHLLASLVYLHGAIYNTVSAVCPVAWSLEVEVQFYILAPLLTSIFVVKNKNLRRLILLVAIFIAASNSAHASTFSIVKHAHLFLLGFLLTDFYAFEWQEKDKSYKWDLPCLLGWLGLLIVVPNYWYLEYTFPLFVFLAYAGALRGKLCAQFFTHPWIVTIGGMCYTIYLYHFYIISALGRFSCKLIIGQSYMLNLVLQALILVPLLLAISTLLFFLFEKPFMRRDWADRLLKIFRPFLPQNKAIQNLGK